MQIKRIYQSPKINDKRKKNKMIIKENTEEEQEEHTKKLKNIKMQQFIEKKPKYY